MKDEGAVERTEEEYKKRERMIAKIEGCTGALTSIPWHLVTTEDVTKLFNTINALSFYDR